MASLGGGTHGNIARLDNVLEARPARLAASVEQLDNTRTQMENAQTQVEQPFLQEKALQEKAKRLDKLNILLNMDERENTLMDGKPDEGAAEVKRAVGLERWLMTKRGVGGRTNAVFAVCV